MVAWDGLRLLCLGGAGQTGREICRRVAENGAATIIIHDLRLARARDAIAEIEADGSGDPGAVFVASAGDLFQPAGLNGWEFVSASGPVSRVCRETGKTGRAEDARDIEGLLDARLGALTPDVVKQSLIWNLVHEYRPQVVVDTVNTATVLGYSADLIQSGRDVAGAARRVLDALRGEPAAPLPVAELRTRLASLEPHEYRAIAADLADVFCTSLDMTASLDAACVIRFVQCLHACFRGDEGVAVPEFTRYVKVHTTGLGGMGLNIRYTHGDTGEPGLSTKLLGKVCATGLLTQLLLTLAHTPGCDARVVVPATLVGWVEPAEAVITGEQTAGKPGPVPLVDCRDPVLCDGSLSLGDALRGAERRITSTGQVLEVPYLASGENRPYAEEDIATVSALGQMGCVSKEEVARAVLDCVAGDSRYDILTAIDSALLLPTQTAAVERDRKLHRCRARAGKDPAFRLPSISLGNLGPTTAKCLYEIEMIRATYETVACVVHEANAMEMTLRVCSHILGDGEGAPLRRQILSLGIPIFLRRGPGTPELLLGNRILHPEPVDAALAQKLDPLDEAFRTWLEQGWIDLTGERMRWWHERFTQVHHALETDRGVSRNWFDPTQPFRAGQFLAYLYSISGGQRKHYM